MLQDTQYNFIYCQSIYRDIRVLLIKQRMATLISYLQRESELISEARMINSVKYEI